MSAINTQPDMVSAQRQALERLMGESWFRKAKPKHPAFQRWALCREIEGLGAIQWPERADALPLLGRMLLDTALLVYLTDGNIHNLALSDRPIFGPDAIPDGVRPRLRDARQFEDTMVELAAAASIRSNNLEVSLTQQAGWPDLVTSLPSCDRPVLLECKHLTTTSRNAIGNVLRKANAQIREAGAGYYGAVVLDVSDAARVGRRANDDSVPQAIESLVQEVRRCVSGAQNRAVSLVIVLWDSYVQMGEPPANTLMVYQRARQFVPHTPGDGVALLEQPDQLLSDFTISYWLRWHPRGRGDNLPVQP